MPRYASEYASRQVQLARSTCLYVATKLGDLKDEIVVVGGLVPSLLIPQGKRAAGVSEHVGTLDLDLGLALGLLKNGRYHTLAERLRNAGFTQDKSDQGNPTRQRWQIVGPESVTVDFLIPPSRPKDRGGALRHLEKDFAAFITPGLDLAFADRRLVSIDGVTPFGERAARDMWVCGPGAYVLLKALAFGLRGQNKDAYDLYYVVRNFGLGVQDVAASLVPLTQNKDAKEALKILGRDFLEVDSPGPLRVAEFLFGGPDGDTQADVVGFVGDLLARCEGGSRRVRT